MLALWRVGFNEGRHEVHLIAQRVADLSNSKQFEKLSAHDRSIGGMVVAFCIDVVGAFRFLVGGSVVGSGSWSWNHG